jgi:predicted nucleotidyltransferase
VENAKIEETLAQFTQEVHQLLGEDLVAVALYGSAAGENFVPGASDLNVALVVKEIRFEVLRKLQPRISAWHALGFAVPLLIDREFLQRGRDVFPMEFHDIKEQHRLLWGEDVFRDLEIDDRHLRFQAEHEARSKLLRLRALYLECATDQQRLQALILDSLKTFLVLMRNLLRLRGGDGPQHYTEVLSHFEQRLQCSFPRMHQLLAIRVNAKPWPAEELSLFFRDYLAEVQQLVAVIDRFASKT